MNSSLPRLHIALGAASIVAIALVWWPTLPYAFQFDDWNVIVADPRVQSLTSWWQSMPGIRPLLKLSYALNHEFAPSTAGFRAVNVALHAGNSVLVYGLARHATLHLHERVDATAVVFVAVLTAAVFALHPVQTQSVTYLSGRSSSLAALGCLASLALFVASRQTERHRIWLHAGALLAFVAALGAKENSLALPAIVVLWLVAVERLGVRAAIRAAVPYFWTLAIAIALLLLTTPYLRLIELSSPGKTLAGNLLTQANGVSYLIGQCLLVRPPNPDPSLAYVTTATAPVLLRGAALLALIALGLWNLRRRPAIAFGMLWFFLWLAPTNSIAPRLDAVSDRQLYLALIGPAWLAARASLALYRSQRIVGVCVAIVVVSLLSIQTWRHNRIYETEVAYWTHVTEQSPRNARAANNLGMAYAQRCEQERAVAAFERALAIEPNDMLARVNRGLLLSGELVERCRSHAAPDD